MYTGVSMLVIMYRYNLTYRRSKLLLLYDAIEFSYIYWHSLIFTGGSILVFMHRYHLTYRRSKLLLLYDAINAVQICVAA